MICIKKVSGLFCGLAWLLALAFCACESVPENCGDGSRLNPETQFCFGGQAYEKCGGKEYDPTVNKCEHNVLKTKCGGGDYYDPASEFCDGGGVYAKCGGQTYNPVSDTCANGVLRVRCGAGSYSPETQFCYSDSVYSKCGGLTYDPAPTTKCEDNILKAQCGNSSYNPATQVCSNGTVQPVIYTLSVSVNPAGGGDVSKEPNAESYNAGTLVTVTATPAEGYTFTGWTGASAVTVNIIQITMDGNKILTANFQTAPPGAKYRVKFSVNGGSGTAPNDILVNAGYSAALPSGNALSRIGYSFGGWNTEISGTGTNYAAGSSYYPTADITLYAKWTPPTPADVLIDSRDGNGYNTVRIGAQTWMAENLNYDVPNNTTDECYHDSVDNCETYGRIYTWSAAMGGASSSSKSPSGVQGVCPVGWHLPSDAEWDTLINFVGGSETAGGKLKSASGWDNNYNRNGTDEYGFSALPGGVYGNSSHSAAGRDGNWWSATERNASDAWYRRMYYNSEYVYSNNHYKTDKLSVRCIADN